MSERNQSDSPNVPDEVWQKIREIAEKSVHGDYIYRGESKWHPKVCSGLYRPYLRSRIENPDVMGSQNVILEQVRTYLPEISNLGDDEILTQLQHYGCRTNLIDFTSDYLIALFFACEALDSENGRVILLRKPSSDATYRVIKTLRIVNRVESQKSILVESTTGFVEPDCIVDIPKGLKSSMRDFLKRCHDISIERIYNDIHGFIKWPKILPHALEFYQEKKAKKERRKAEAEKREKDAKVAEKKAIAHSNAALALVLNAPIELEPENAMAYRNRGFAYSEIIGPDSILDAALEHYDKAVDLDPNQPLFYFERAIIRLRRQEWDEARADLEAARNRGAKLKRLFNQEIRNFEEQYEVVLPEDIAEMLLSEETQEEN